MNDAVDWLDSASASALGVDEVLRILASLTSSDLGRSTVLSMVGSGDAASREARGELFSLLESPFEDAELVRRLEAEPLELGHDVSIAGTFEAGQKVDVTGTTKGRGFTGVVKRWSFSTHGASHGTHEYFRHGGAVSAGSYPGRILPGKKMAGQYGSERVTTRGLRVVRVDAERNLLFIRGAVPGHRNGIVRVRPALGG